MNIGDAIHGARVMYTPQRECGTIESVNAHYVFVKYDGDNHTKATSPGDLVLLPSRGQAHGIQG